MIASPMKTAEHAVALHLMLSERLEYCGPKPNSVPGVMPFNGESGNRIVLVRLTSDSGVPIPIHPDEIDHYKNQASEMERQLWVANVHVDDSGMNPTLKDIYQLLP